MNLCTLYRNDAYETPVPAAAFVGDNTVCCGVECVVLADTHVRARVYSCAALADEDIPGLYKLTGIAFDPTSLAVAVPSILCHTT